MRIYVSERRIEKYPFESSTQVEIKRSGKYYANTSYIHTPILIESADGKNIGIYAVDTNGCISAI